MSLHAYVFTYKRLTIVFENFFESDLDLLRERDGSCHESNLIINYMLSIIEENQRRN
jgi:hypothetical protein